MYRLPGLNPGLLQGGNINLAARARLRVPNPFEGGYSSVYSITSTLPPGMPNAGKAVLIPGVIHQGGRWQVVPPTPAGMQRAFDYYMATKKHLGVFDTIKQANAYADRLHRQQAMAAMARRPARR